MEEQPQLNRTHNRIRHHYRKLSTWLEPHPLAHCVLTLNTDNEDAVGVLLQDGGIQLILNGMYVCMCTYMVTMATCLSNRCM